MVIHNSAGDARGNARGGRGLSYQDFPGSSKPTARYELRFKPSVATDLRGMPSADVRRIHGAVAIVVVLAQDAAYGALQVWRDLNGNGRSDPGELQALADAGVVSISTGYSVSGEVDAYGHEHRQVATLLLANGTASTAADVWFKVDAVWRVNAPTQRLPASRIARHAAHPPARLTQFR